MAPLQKEGFMTEYLIQDGSNTVFVSTPALLVRGDMRPYQMPGTKPEAMPVKTEPAAPVSSDPDPKPVQNKAVILPGETKPAMDARAEMEAIEDPDEMIAFIFQKYGLKLTKTMKKSTMIERAMATMQENKGAL